MNFAKGCKKRVVEHPEPLQDPGSKSKEILIFFDWRCKEAGRIFSQRSCHRKSGGREVGRICFVSKPAWRGLLVPFMPVRPTRCHRAEISPGNPPIALGGLNGRRKSLV
jgi:hypothetical protein